MRSCTRALSKPACPLQVAEFKGLAVVGERELRLAQVLQTDREVVGVVRVVGLQLVGLVVGLLGLRPLRHASVQVAQCEVQVGRRLARNQLLESRLGHLRIGLTQQRDQTGLCGGVARVELQHAAVAGARRARCCRAGPRSPPGPAAHRRSVVRPASTFSYSACACGELPALERFPGLQQGRGGGRRRRLRLAHRDGVLERPRGLGGDDLPRAAPHAGRAPAARALRARRPPDRVPHPERGGRRCRARVRLRLRQPGDGLGGLHGQSPVPPTRVRLDRGGGRGGRWQLAPVRAQAGALEMGEGGAGGLAFSGGLLKKSPRRMPGWKICRYTYPPYNSKKTAAVAAKAWTGRSRTQSSQPVLRSSLARRMVAAYAAPVPPVSGATVRAPPMPGRVGGGSVGSDTAGGSASNRSSSSASASSGLMGSSSGAQRRRRSRRTALGTVSAGRRRRLVRAALPAPGCLLERLQQKAHGVVPVWSTLGSSRRRSFSSSLSNEGFLTTIGRMKITSSLLVDVLVPISEQVADAGQVSGVGH